ncbi:MAG: hypothetical protein K2L06_06905 [Alistipes sp.]|nr:hypothetical protein [Alistipes sp.]
MKTLITPLQAVKLAFGDSEILPPETLAEADIAAAEQRWIVPAIGRKLHDRLLAGLYADLVTDYLAAPTALYTRALVQPRLDVRTDRLGTLAPKPANGAAAGDEARRGVRRQLLEEARTLLQRATDCLTANRRQYPEYAPDENRAPGCSIAGGIVLPDDGR